jgi:hypothetical protein
MKAAAAYMTAQVPVEGGIDVIKLVKHRDELLVEFLIQEPRHTEGQVIQHFLIAHEVALQTVELAASVSQEPAALESQWRNARLQAVAAPCPGWCHADQEARNIDVPQRGATQANVGAQSADRV